jgi:hypothetical protein
MADSDFSLSQEQDMTLFPDSLTEKSYSQEQENDSILVLDIHDSIVNSYSGKGCWARPAFTKQYVLRNKQEVLQWSCKSCNHKCSINAATTSNIRSHLKGPKKAKLVHFTQSGFNELMVKYSVHTDQSFLSVQHPAFVELLDYCRPGIELPKTKKIKQEMIITMARKKDEIRAKLKNKKLI